MILLNGYLHRQRLAAIISRLVALDSDGSEAVYRDSLELKKIVNFNAYTGCLILDSFARSLFGALQGKPVHSTAVKRKGELKDFILSLQAATTSRSAEILADYQSRPWDFYRETPFNGRIYHFNHMGTGVFGSARVKRFRRISEKASRYFINVMHQAIKVKAASLALQRADRMGMDRSRLVTASDEQSREYAQAEAGVMEAIHQGHFEDLPVELPLNDILGVKVVGTQEVLDRATDILASSKTCSIIERETHTGNYNATHLLVRFRWPRDLINAHPPAPRAREILLERGCSCEIEKTFLAFVSDADDEVVVEVGLSLFDDLLESEFGASMHEKRILAQRKNLQYQGSLAKNIEYLIGYLFHFCLAPARSLDTVPIRLWGRYLPDYIYELFLGLCGVSEETDFTQECLCNDRLPGTFSG